MKNKKEILEILLQQLERDIKDHEETGRNYIWFLCNRIDWATKDKKYHSEYIEFNEWFMSYYSVAREKFGAIDLFKATEIANSILLENEFTYEECVYENPWWPSKEYKKRLEFVKHLIQISND